MNTNSVPANAVTTALRLGCDVLIMSDPASSELTAHVYDTTNDHPKLGGIGIDALANVVKTVCHDKLGGLCMQIYIWKVVVSKLTCDCSECGIIKYVINDPIANNITDIVHYKGSKPIDEVMVELRVLPANDKVRYQLSRYVAYFMERRLGGDAWVLNIQKRLPLKLF